MSTFVDKALHCAGCGADFTFTAGEQEFHASKGFTNEPRRCPACRRARRAERGDVPAGASAQAVGSAPRAPRPAGNGAPRRERREGDAAGGDAPARTATRAESRPRDFIGICSACGSETTLPFEPVGNRPVLCSTCYDKIRAFA